MNPGTVFQAKGFLSTKDTGVFAMIFIVLLVLGILSFMSGGNLGPWWLYLTIAVISYVVMNVRGHKGEVVLQIAQENSGEISVTVAGKSNTRRLVIDRFSYWQFTKFYGTRTNSNVLLMLQVKGKDGSVLNLMATRAQEEPMKDWPVQEREFGAKEERFEVDQLDQVVATLNSFAAKE